jgi:hypothetical protein
MTVSVVFANIKGIKLTNAQLIDCIVIIAKKEAMKQSIVGT